MLELQQSCSIFVIQRTLNAFSAKHTHTQQISYKHRVVKTNKQKKIKKIYQKTCWWRKNPPITDISMSSCCDVNI